MGLKYPCFKASASSGGTPYMLDEVSTLRMRCSSVEHGIPPLRRSCCIRAWISSLTSPRSPKQCKPHVHVGVHRAHGSSSSGTVSRLVGAALGLASSGRRGAKSGSTVDAEGSNWDAGGFAETVLHRSHPVFTLSASIFNTLLATSFPSVPLLEKPAWLGRSLAALHSGHSGHAVPARSSSTVFNQPHGEVEWRCPLHVQECPAHAGPGALLGSPSVLLGSLRWLRVLPGRNGLGFGPCSAVCLADRKQLLVNCAAAPKCVSQGVVLRRTADAAVARLGCAP